MRGMKSYLKVISDKVSTDSRVSAQQPDYLNGYLDALVDVQLLINGVTPKRYDWYKKEIKHG